MEAAIRSSFFVALFFLLLLIACEDSVAPRNVSYQEHIQEAIFNLSCLVGCHDGARQAGLELTTWATLMEEGTLGFKVERANEPSGPFTVVGDWVEAQGPGYPYTFRDDSAEPGTRPWYRVVENTVDGRGDVTRVLQVRDWQGRGNATGGRSRSRSRSRTR